MTLLFEHFLDDPTEYEACERYWEQLVAQIAHDLGQDGEWPSWQARHYANGTPMEKDGNPICEGRSNKLDRAFRIIQHEASAADIVIGGWMSHEEEFVPELPRDELVIALALSQGSGELAEDLLRRWMTPDTTAAEMASYLKQVLDTA